MAPATITQQVSDGNETITLQMTKETIRGSYFEVLVQNSSGTYDTYTAGEVRTYMGTVDEYPGAIAAGILLSNDVLKTRVYFDRGYTWFTYGSSVTGTRGDLTSTYALPTTDTISANHAGTDTYLFDIGIDVEYRHYSDSSRGGSSVAKCLENVEFSMANMKAVYTRDLLLRPALGRVIVRTSQTYCPYYGLTGGSILDATRAEWENNQRGQTTYDAAAVACVGDVGGGLAWNSGIGSNMSMYSVNNSESDGSFDIIWRHELGHNWSANDMHGGQAEGRTVMNGNKLGRFGAPATESILNHRDANTGILDNIGSYTSIDAPPYAALDASDNVQVVAGTPVSRTYDVLANDYDGNGDAISILSCDSTSQQGGQVAISSGTGPGGRDEITYTTPNSGSDGLDYFYYTIQDSTGQTATGIVLIPVSFVTWVETTDADTFVRGSDSTNYGSENYLFIKRDSAGATSSYTRTGWVHFDISNRHTFNAAELTFTCYGGISSNETVTVWGIKDGQPGDELGVDWTELTINSTNAPLMPDFAEDSNTTMIGTFQSSTVAGTTFKVKSPELDSFLQADTNGEVTFLLVKEMSSYPLEVCSKENGSGAATLSSSPVLPADAYVRDGSSADTNYGSETFLRVKSDNTGYNRQAYLRFDYSDVTTDNVQSATLKLTPVSVVSGVTLRIRLVDDSLDGWQEDAITWNNQPTSSGSDVQLSSNNLTVAQQYSIDVTSLVNQAMNANGVATFHIDSLTAGSSYMIDFASKEDAATSYHPVLDVTANTGDTTPPAAPTGLGATAGDGSVSLDWTDNSEGDLESYTVYRSTTSGSGYAAVAQGVSSSDYTDNTVTNGTTYYYVVTAIDTSSNESGYSSEVSATPQGQQTVEMYVNSIVMGSRNAGPNYWGQATVHIKDDTGANVSGATVYGTWSGAYSGSVSGTTAADGTVFSRRRTRSRTAERLRLP
ncbi:DUF7594 domain-containing protein [Anaerohalosphaera lusitana]|uniref:CBM96 family carbohydrate-binding protein n=1 Tax=Anaerohalosphaera lusitana TaxID=1936003 RepID=UPI001472FB40|nr:DNRLRE domain-containing protein [Anaerohalosphaera lusitana]